MLLKLFNLASKWGSKAVRIQIPLNSFKFLYVILAWRYRFATISCSLGAVHKLHKALFRNFWSILRLPPDAFLFSPLLLLTFVSFSPFLLESTQCRAQTWGGTDKNRGLLRYTATGAPTSKNSRKRLISFVISLWTTLPSPHRWLPGQLTDFREIPWRAARLIPSRNDTCNFWPQSCWRCLEPRCCDRTFSSIDLKPLFVLILCSFD